MPKKQTKDAATPKKRVARVGRKQTASKKNAAKGEGPWGGWRPGSGRPVEKGSGVSHGVRQAVTARTPVHIIMKLDETVASLRRAKEHAALRAALALGAEAPGFRLVHYAVKKHEVHLLVEATNRARLARGVQGLSIRVARAMNKFWDESGKFYADRYGQHVLTTPAEVHRLFCFFFITGRTMKSKAKGSGRVETYSSAPWFDGWSRKLPAAALTDEEAPVVPAKSALVRTGWRKLGKLSPG